MNNDEAIKYRNKLPKINNFTIMELYQMPKYFGWLKHSINRINNIHMFLGGNDDGVALRCFWNNHYEKKTLEIWSKLSAIEGIILDIGAHTGIYSLAANNSIKKGQILSFEPHFLNFARLNLNLRGNGFSTRTMFMNTVGKQNQIQPFSVMNNIDYLTSGGKIGNIKNQFTTQIQTIAIDSFLDKTARNNVKLIKIDVEGNEYQCLQGMIETIKSSKPIIFFECISEKNNLEIETVLKSHDYSFFIIDDTEGFLEKTENINPILDNNNNIINRYINRLAIPKTKLNLIIEFLN
ncbi:FkbM family methyltransferase [Alphaproteobacteria bacterium]|nr:FkbM family methyltransferase [Alphaproteobacteria bacterium]